MFMAPSEVDYRIRTVAGKNLESNENVTPIDIIRWVLDETCTQTCLGGAQWAMQGIRYQLRQSAWSAYSHAGADPDALGDAWREKESRTLMELYSVSDSSTSTLQTLILQAQRIAGIQPRTAQLKAIEEQAKRFNFTAVQEVKAQEEQEREIAQEREEQPEVQRPRRLTPRTHSVSQLAMNFVRTGKVSSCTVRKPYHVMRALEHTTFTTLMEESPWSTSIMATDDFQAAVMASGTEFTSDDYLRSVAWILTSSKSHDVLIISPHEANELLPQIRRSKQIAMHIYIPRTKQSMRNYNKLDFFSVGASMHQCCPDPHIMRQVSLFSGQLFFPDHDDYMRVCRWLGIWLRGSQRSEEADDGDGELPEDVGSDGFRPNWGGSDEIPFQQNPLPFLGRLLSARRKGVGFRNTHVGKMVAGNELSKSIWKNS